LIAESATFALKAGLCVRRVRFVMFAPDPRQHRCCQAGNPPIDLSEFPEPSLPAYGQRLASLIARAAFQPIEGAGHMPMLEAEEAFTTAVESFLGLEENRR
jgi:hypothetical protein